MSVIEFGQPVALRLPRALYDRLAESAQENGLPVEQEMVDRLARSFQRRRASDAMDDFLAAACRPEAAG